MIKKRVRTFIVITTALVLLFELRPEFLVVDVVAAAKRGFVAVFCELLFIYRRLIAADLKVCDATPVAFRFAGDDGRVVKEAVHVPAVCAINFFVPGEVGKFCAVVDANVLRAHDERNAIERKGRMVVDFEEYVEDDRRNYHHPDERYGKEITEECVRMNRVGVRFHRERVARGRLFRV